MKKSELKSIIRETVKRTLNEMDHEYSNYMFFEDLKSIKRMCDKLMTLDQTKMDTMITNGHDWAEDHMAEAKSKLGEVTGFFVNELGDEGNIK